MITNRDLEIDPLFRSARIGTLRRDATLTGQLFSVSTEPLLSMRLFVDANGAPPRWLYPSLRRLEKIARLPKGWDSYGAQPVAVESIEGALDVMNDFMMDFDDLQPDIAPTVRGGIEIGFHRGTEDLELTVMPDGVVAFYEDSHGSSWEGDIRQHRAQIRSVLQRMST
jgi:hypothetical protein